MDMGADDDEMDMMYAMEQEQNAADKDGGAFQACCILYNA